MKSCLANCALKMLQLLEALEGDRRVLCEGTKLKVGVAWRRRLRLGLGGVLNGRRSKQSQAWSTQQPASVPQIPAKNPSFFKVNLDEVNFLQTVLQDLASMPARDAVCLLCQFRTSNLIIQSSFRTTSRQPSWQPSRSIAQLRRSKPSWMTLSRKVAQPTTKPTPQGRGNVRAN